MHPTEEKEVTSFTSAPFCSPEAEDEQISNIKKELEDQRPQNSAVSRMNRSKATTLITARCNRYSGQCPTPATAKIHAQQYLTNK
jgi:hypothetical protein